MSNLASIDENKEVRQRKNAKNSNAKVDSKTANSKTSDSKKSVAQVLKNKNKKSNDASIEKRRLIAILVKVSLLLCGLAYWYFVGFSPSTSKSSKPRKNASKSTNSQKTSKTQKSESSSPKNPESNTIAYQTSTYNTPNFQELDCSEEYSTSPPTSDNCTPTKCGRLVLDGVLTDEELEVLTSIATDGTMIAGGGAGGASIIELHTSSASAGENFISLFNRAKQGHEETIEGMEGIYSEYNMQKYKEIKEKLMGVVAETWGIDQGRLNLAAPTFFSRLTNKKAVTENDQYWHKHVDTLQYRVFHYTGLVYLSDYSTDFEGGRFIFDTVDRNSKFKAKGHPTQQIVEPKKGRFSVFTSGHENPHHVERVSDGIRYAFTMGFTCNSEFKIDDPALPKDIVKAKVPDFDHGDEEKVENEKEKLSGAYVQGL